MEGSNKIVELQEKISEALIDVAHKRNIVPEECARILKKNLQLQLQNSEKTIFLPKKNLKKIVCKYPTDKSVQTVFDLQDEQPIDDISISVAQVREDQVNLLKVISMMNAKPSDEAHNIECHGS